MKSGPDQLDPTVSNVCGLQVAQNHRRAGLLSQLLTAVEVFVLMEGILTSHHDGGFGRDKLPSHPHVLRVIQVWHRINPAGSSDS